MKKPDAGRFSPALALKGVCGGIDKGARSFTTLTNGIGAPWRAPEYFLVVHAAKAIKRLAPEYDVWCESSARQIADLGGGKKGGRYIKELPKYARFDIAILNAGSTPKILVEIKRHVTSVIDVERDFRRLTRSIHDSGVRAVIMAFLISALDDGRGRGPGTLDSRRNAILNSIRQDRDDLVIRDKEGPIHRQSTWSRRDERDRLHAWQAVCLYAKAAGRR